MKLKLPKQFRPNNIYRMCELGVDLPREFMDEIHSIDSSIYPVWHPYKVLYDTIMNTHTGELEDPRNTVHMEGSEMVFGFVLTDGKGQSLEDGTWHLWRWSWPHGVAHIIQLKSREPEYLKIVTRMLHVQAKWTDKYGFRSYNALLRDMEEDKREQMMKDREDLFMATQEENDWLLKKAMENMDRGVTAPTNPQKETITSFGGQTNRSRIIRPMDDEDAGLILPD